MQDMYPIINIADTMETRLVIVEASLLIDFYTWI